MSVTRIETGVAVGYWDRWGVTHALKELIANAKDATGGGFDKRCLMLGAGEEIRAGD